jgi:hypothetical protein
LASIEKELKQVKMNNAALARYINAKRKNEEDWRKEEACSLLLASFEYVLVYDDLL